MTDQLPIKKMDRPSCICGYSRQGIAQDAPCPECGSLKLKSTSSRNARISTVLTLIAASGSVLFLLFKVGVLIRYEINNWSYDGWMILSYFFFLLGYLPISAFALAFAGVSILKKEPNRKTARNVILLLAGLVLPLLMIFYGLYLHGNLP